ncbi:hypothetical protein BGX24_004084 [Mortierella sp. AD032]|nr:hypothetical protein BGX24_004084 [Mortierella sp. AD032]
MKEKDLLASFLVGNELHDSVTFTKFTSYFPSAHRSNPELKDLYRAYTNTRHQVRTKVRRNIEVEARRNPFHTTPEQQQLEQQRQHHEQQQDSAMMALEGFDELEPEDIDTYMDIEDVDKHLTLDQAIQELALAEKTYKKVMEQMERDCNTIAQEFQDLDQEVDSVIVPSKRLLGVNEVDLANDLQTLIEMCDSLTSEVQKMQ